MPKRLFYHFYLVAALWAAFLMAAVMKQGASSWSAVLTLVLLELHALRRLYESLCVFRYGDAKMHVVGELSLRHTRHPLLSLACHS